MVRRQLVVRDDLADRQQHHEIRQHGEGCQSVPVERPQAARERRADCPYRHQHAPIPE
jgi:hypothetical protein